MKKKDATKSTLEKAAEVGITLKKVRTFDGRRGTAIEADVYLNGKLIAHASDEGIGGCMHIEAAFKKNDFDEMRANRKLIQEVEDKLAKYPEYTIEHVGHSYKTKDRLDTIIDYLIDEESAKKAMKREEKKGIVLDGSIIHWNSGTLPNMIKKFGKERTVAVVQKKYDELKAKKEKVLNKEYLKSLGVKI